MTDTRKLLTDLLKVQERIGAQLQEAAKEAQKLAKVDVYSPEAVQATDEELKLRELKQKVDNLVNRAVEFFP
jgi:hypothetical protein